MRLVVSAPEGEMLSQVGTPPGTDALAVKLVGLAAVTDRICGAGAVLFNVPLNTSDVGLSVIPLVACATASLTLTVCVPRNVRREIVPP